MKQIGVRMIQVNKKKLLRCFCIFSILFIMCILPLMAHTIEIPKHTVSIPAGSKSATISEGQQIEQLIHIQGPLKKVGIWLSVTNTAQKSGNIEVTVTQGKNTTSGIIVLSQTRTGDYTYPIMDFSNFTTGTAKVSISVKNIPKDTSVCYTLSDYAASGLPGAVVNGKEAVAPLAISYEITKISFLFYYSIILTFLLLIVLLLVSFLLVYKSNLKSLNLILFLCSVLIITLVISIRQPMASLLGEPFSEAAYDFWYYAKEGGFWGSLMKLEAGLYLSWMQRIVAFVAVKLSPSSKYVFVIMQMIQTLFIACVTSMFCLKSFNRYFGNLTRLLFSVFLGTLLIWMPSYMYHMLGYWGLIFIIGFALLDMDQLKRWQYIGGLILTAIFCVSKLYYFALAPVAIILLIFMRKESSKRFKLYFSTILFFTVFNFGYSIYAQMDILQRRQGLGSIQNIGIFHLLYNTVYFQVQVLNSFFTGKVQDNPILINFMFLFIFIAVLFFCIYRLIQKDYKISKGIFYAATSLGIMSFSILAMNIITSAGEVDMSRSVNWNENIIMRSQHTFFCYVAIAFLCMVGLYLVKEKFESWNRSFKDEKERSKIMPVVFRTAEITISAIFVLLTVRFAPVKDMGWYTNMSDFPTQWQNVYQVTNRDAYYIPINVGYPNALNSLSHNSYGVLFGYDTGGVWRQLQHGEKMDMQKAYSTAKIGDIWPLEKAQLLSVSVRKANLNFDSVYSLIIRDKEGNELTRINQSNSVDRQWIDFMLDKPISRAYSFEFVHNIDGSPAYISDAINMGIKEGTPQ